MQPQEDFPFLAQFLDLHLTLNDVFPSAVGEIFDQLFVGLRTAATFLSRTQPIRDDLHYMDARDMIIAITACPFMSNYEVCTYPGLKHGDKEALFDSVLAALYYPETIRKSRKLIRRNFDCDDSRSVLDLMNFLLELDDKINAHVAAHSIKCI